MDESSPPVSRKRQREEQKRQRQEKESKRARQEARELGTELIELDAVGKEGDSAHDEGIDASQGMEGMEDVDGDLPGGGAMQEVEVFASDDLSLYLAEVSAIFSDNGGLPPFIQQQH